ncbi:MAG: hypothetical protein AAF764_08575 [Pseudomonadota bacterium]
MTEKITAEEARQGRKGYHVATILAVGLGLMAIAWVIFEVIWR